MTTRGYSWAHLSMLILQHMPYEMLLLYAKSERIMR